MYKYVDLHKFIYSQKLVFIALGFHDIQPDISENSFGTSIKFLPFRRVVARMGVWLKKQRVILESDEFNYHCLICSEMEVSDQL